MSLPDEMEAILGDSRAGDFARFIELGRVDGPIVRDFRRIRDTEGDEAAAWFLAAEADGFHVTPYGFCLANFTVEPCPKHLECFNNCNQLAATGIPEQIRNLVQLRRRISLAHDAALERPAGTIGRENQIKHAQVRIEGIDRLLKTAPGDRVFPNGHDLSRTATPKTPLDA